MSENHALSVLITSAGCSAAINCIQALKHQSELSLKLVAIDMTRHSPGLQLVDTAYLVPPISSSEYIDEVLHICSKEQIAVVLPTFSTEIIKFANSREEFQYKGIGLIVPPSDTVTLFSRKWSSYCFYIKHNFPTVSTFLGSELPGALQYPLFLKPDQGSGSRQSYKLGDSDDLRYYTQKMNQPYVVQEFIGDRAQEFTADIFVGDDSVILAAVVRERLRVKDGMAIVARTVGNASILGTFNRLISKIEIIGPANIQYFKIDDGPPLLFDVNTRFSAGGLPLSVAVGANIPLMTVKYALGLPIKPILQYEEGVIMLRYYDTIIASEATLK